MYKEVCYYYFAKNLVDISVSYNKLYRYFNEVWSKQREKLTKVLKPEALSNINQPIKYIFNFLTNADEVISFQHEGYIEIYDTVVHGTIDAIIYNKKTNTIRLVYIPDSYFINNSSSEYGYILSYLYHFYKQSEFLSNKRKLELCIFIPSINNIATYPVSDCKNFEELLLTTVKAISSGNFYPVPNKYNCNRCLFYKNCNWKNK